ncbi:MAG: Uma2 family endonuclease [bacterium]|nr:Uma2 family endonuclease [bacterium]
MVYQEVERTDAAFVVPEVPIWRLTVAQYHQMIEAGILTEEDRVELLEGWLVTKMPKNPPHSISTQLTRDVLAKIIPEGWFVTDQEPITTLTSEPEPDVTVVKGQRRDFRDHHPDPKDVAIVIEVSDSTLKYDRTLKLRLYAKVRIPVYWIINLPERRIEVYTEPTGEGTKAHYEQQQNYGEGDMVPVILDGQGIGRVAAAEILP